MAGTREEPADGFRGAAPSQAEVRAALERIRSRPPLVRSARLSSLLSYVVEETLADRGDRIIAYTIAIDVFGKEESFDPAVDTIVRVEAGRLRRRLAEYYGHAGAEDPVEIDIPKGGYAAQFRYRGNGTAKAAVAGGRADRGPAIAVLPFDNYSGDPGDQFFADGLTEETIANLARYKDLFVFSRSTTAKHAAEGADIRRLREALGVDFVLESSVRRTEQRVRVTIQLIDAATEGHIFAERFERPCTPDGLFEIQDEIALLVAGRVADRYGPVGRYSRRAHRTGRSERWETYLWTTRFFDYYAVHDPTRHLEVRDGLERALNDDPGSSDGWAALSIVLLDEYRFHFNERTGFPALDRALEHALRAVTCDPENAFAYQALALAHYHKRDVTDFRIAGTRAVELNPGNADVLADIGFCHAIMGDWDRGLPLLRRAIELSPVHPGWYRMPIAFHHFMNGDAEAAIVELKQAPMIGHYWFHAHLACFFAELGDAAAAAREAAEVLALNPAYGEQLADELQVWCTHEALADKLLAGWRKVELATV